MGKRMIRHRLPAKLNHEFLNWLLPGARAPVASASASPAAASRDSRPPGVAGPAQFRQIAPFSGKEGAGWMDETAALIKVIITSTPFRNSRQRGQSGFSPRDSMGSLLPSSRISISLFPFEICVFS